MAKELPTVAEGERAERCETCKWGEVIDRPHDDSEVVCHRYPPVYDPVYSWKWEQRRQYVLDNEERAKSVDASDSPAGWSFPRTHCHDFCGEWQAK